MKNLVSVVMLTMLAMGVFAGCSKAETPIVEEPAVETPVVEEQEAEEPAFEEPEIEEDLPYTYRISEEMSRTFEEKEKNTEPEYVNSRDMNMTTDGELNEQDIELGGRLDGHLDILFNIISGVYGISYNNGDSKEDSLSMGAYILPYLASEEFYESNQAMWANWYENKADGSADNMVVTMPTGIVEDAAYGKTITYIVEFVMNSPDFISEGETYVKCDKFFDNEKMKVAITFVKHGNRLVAVQKEDLTGK